jgi:UDP-N-acetylmuramate dehydrogenase
VSPTSEIAAGLVKTLPESGFTGSLSTDKPLAPLTTWGVGGPGALVAEIPNKSDLRLLFKECSPCHLPILVMGAGSNLLVSDDGYPGIIIHLSGDFDRLETEGNTADVGAAYPLMKLVREGCRLGFGGIERLAGIPGTVGGALVMNAGTFNEYIGSLIVNVEIFSPDMGFSVIGASDCRFAYRSSRFQDSNEIILGCTLRFQTADPSRITAEVERRLERRKCTQPINLPSCGSVFRNPPGESKAAQLIERAGLKGASKGGAAVSRLHANFIVNTGNAKATDIVSLMALIRRTVREKFAVTLVPEVRGCGFSAPLEVILDEWTDR